MLVMSLGPVLSVVGGLTLALGVCIVAFILVADRAVTTAAHDPERANRLLTMKLRAPWKYQATRLARKFTD